MTGERRQTSLAVVVGPLQHGLRHDCPFGLPRTALEDVETSEDHQYIHAMVVVADRARSIIGSAHYTVSGLERTVEVGVVVGGQVEREIVEVVAIMPRRGLHACQLWTVPT